MKFKLTILIVFVLVSAAALAQLQRKVSYELTGRHWYERDMFPFKCRYFKNENESRKFYYLQDNVSIQEADEKFFNDLYQNLIVCCKNKKAKDKFYYGFAKKEDLITEDTRAEFEKIGYVAIKCL